jgi:hypothetical protein
MSKVSSGQAALVDSAVSPWASMTFSGDRHSFDIALNSADVEHSADQLASMLNEEDFDLPGELVADFAITSQSQALDGSPLFRIEALTVAHGA